MKIAHITKDSADVRRFTVDFLNDEAGPWLDDGEVISSITTPAITIEQYATWQYGSYVSPPITTPTDTTPLVIVSAGIIAPTLNGVSQGNVQVQIFVGVGTPGLTYKVTFVATGSTSGRQKQISVLVTIRGVPPVSSGSSSSGSGSQTVTIDIASFTALLLTLQTNEPNVSGVPWLNGGVVQLS